jgi:predicted peptidase
MIGYRVLVVVLVAWLTQDLIAKGAHVKETGFIPRVHQGPDGKEAKYVVFVPHDYKGDRAYPVILFLHGAGEWGTDGQKQLTVGLGPAVRQREKTFPFLVVFPQSQRQTWGISLANVLSIHNILATWSADQPEGKRALAMLAAVEKDYRVDPERVYLTGVSMGGYGVWSLAASQPERWAAIVPVCGGGEPGAARKIKALPCWCFHGEDDKSVAVSASRAMVKALWAAGGHPNYTEYAGVGHDSWVKAYDTDDLYEWLLRHRRKARP